MRTYILYIHASNDIIKPIEIDLATVYAVQQNNGQLAGDSMAREIAAQIEQHFPKSQAHNALVGIMPLLKYLNIISGSFLEGIVIRVPGIIDEPQSTNTAPGITSAQVQQQIDLLRKQYDQLLQKERAAASVRQTRLEKDLVDTQQRLTISQVSENNLQINEQKLRKELQEAVQRRQELETRLQEAALRANERERQLQQTRSDLNTLAQERGDLNMQVQMLKAQQQQIVQQNNTAQVESIKELNLRLQNSDKAGDSLRSQLKRTREDLDRAQKERETWQGRYETLKKQFDDLRGTSTKNGKNVVDNTILD